MAFGVQVTIDCADPHGLADWWAETLGWQVEPQDEAFIRSMIDQGFATEGETTRHRGALVWRTGAAIRSDDVTLAGAPRILFQLVPEAKAVKNRVHLDLRGTGPDTAELRQRLIERGATELGHGQQGPLKWTTMADPEGNEFCV